MSWKKYSANLRWYNVFRGVWSREPLGDIPYGKNSDGEMACYLARATDVYAPGISAVLRKRPGFARINTSAIAATAICTSLIHQGEMADRLLSTWSIAGTDHDIYAGTSSMAAIASGTKFTIGADNLIDAAHFHNGSAPGTILTERVKTVVPQFITNGGVRSDFTIAGTGLTSLKPEILTVAFQRAIYGDVDVDGTVFDDRVYWSAIRDGNLIDDPVNDFESTETYSKDHVRMLRPLSDLILVGKLNNLFSLVPTPEQTESFALLEEPLGVMSGPVSQQASIVVDQECFWLGQDNIYSFGPDLKVKAWADAIQPLIEGLQDTRREFSVCGYNPFTKIIEFCVSDAGQTTNQLVIALNVKTGAIYIWAKTRNAYGYRFNSDQRLMIGGGYIGRAYDEQTGTSGSGDDSTSVIGADVISPWFRTRYGEKAKIPYVFVAVDPIASETLTITYALDDEDILAAPRTPVGSPYTVSGTDNKIIAVPIHAFAQAVKIRVTNSVAGAVMSIKAIGVPGDVFQLSVAA